MEIEETIKNKYPTLYERSQYTKDKLKLIRESLDKSLNKLPNADKFCIVTTGSYGRLEASDESDIDLFIINDKDVEDSEVSEFKEKASKIIDEVVPKDNGDTGTFGVEVSWPINTIVENIGGNKDDNSKLTRRMLFLLEGKWIFNEEKFTDYRKQLLEKYIKPDIPLHQLNRFFLNDIIRYYRTMTTDFEYKVHENEKNWGLRNIKLRFSRKMLYFGGLIVVAETCHKTRNEKIETTIALLKLSPVERIIKLSNTEPDILLGSYQNFLESVSDKDKRSELELVEKEKRNESELFSSLKGLGQHFSWSLSLWITNNYDKNHPIHHSLLF